MKKTRLRIVAFRVQVCSCLESRVPETSLDERQTYGRELCRSVRQFAACARALTAQLSRRTSASKSAASRILLAFGPSPSLCSANVSSAND